MKKNSFEIKQEPFYTTSYVAKEVDINDSTVRHWSNEFDDFLKIKRLVSHRRFTKKDIDNLKVIKYLLKDKKIPINEIKHYFNTMKSNNTERTEQQTQEVSYSNNWRQIDCQIRFLKDAITKYEIARENDLIEELHESIQEIEKRNNKTIRLYKLVN